MLALASCLIGLNETRQLTCLMEGGSQFCRSSLQNLRDHPLQVSTSNQNSDTDHLLPQPFVLIAAAAAAATAIMSNKDKVARNNVCRIFKHGEKYRIIIRWHCHHTEH
jgi:hypothetical protein